MGIESSCRRDASISDTHDWVFAAAVWIQDLLNDGGSADIVKSVKPADVHPALAPSRRGSIFSAICLPETQVAYDAAKTAEFGEERSVAGQTVKFRVANVYCKLGVSRTEETHYAHGHGLVDHSLRDHG